MINNPQSGWGALYFDNAIDFEEFGVLHEENAKPKTGTKGGYTEHRFFKRVISENIEAFEEDGLMPLERQKPKGAKGG